MAGDVNVQYCNVLLCPVDEYRDSCVERFMRGLARCGGEVLVWQERQIV